MEGSEKASEDFEAIWFLITCAMMVHHTQTEAQPGLLAKLNSLRIPGFKSTVKPLDAPYVRDYIYTMHFILNKYSYLKNCGLLLMCVQVSLFKSLYYTTSLL